MPTTFEAKTSDEWVDEWLALIWMFPRILAVGKKEQFNRRISIGDLLPNARPQHRDPHFAEPSNELPPLESFNSMTSGLGR